MNQKRSVVNQTNSSYKDKNTLNKNNFHYLFHSRMTYDLALSLWNNLGKGRLQKNIGEYESTGY